MIPRISMLVVLISLALPPSRLVAAAPAAPGLDGVLAAYESVRLALLADTLDGVPAAARRLATDAAALRGALTPAAAGVPAAKLADVEALLPEVEKAAAALAAATSLTAGRDAFYALSKPLVRWRAVGGTPATGAWPVVAFCSMAQRSWLQPKGEIGNPYYGQSMATCGELVPG
jgi:hypothetical protein